MGWRQPSPSLAILNRWLRWIVFSLGFAFIAVDLSWSTRPHWLLFCTFFLCWFLLETVYNWILVGFLNWSKLPLFPKYRTNQNGDEWPSQKQFIRMREWLRSQSFKSLAAVKAQLDEGIVLRSSIYQSSDDKVRLQITFVPHKASSAIAYFSIVSVLADDRRVITDNVYLPFGGYFPQNWEVERRPTCHSLEQLLKRHMKRCERTGSAVRPWSAQDDDPLDELNRQQNLMEKTNTEQGFLLPGMFREEYGNLSMEGRYRIWKEMWLLNYFGTTVRSR